MTASNDDNQSIYCNTKYFLRSIIISKIKTQCFLSHNVSTIFQFNTALQKREGKNVKLILI